MTLTVILAGMVASAALGQVRDGDLVLTVTDGPYSPTSGFVLYVDPTNPARLMTLMPAPAGTVPGCLRMAVNNGNMMLGLGGAGSASLLEIGPGTYRQLATLPGDPSSLELDHDGKWVVAANRDLRGWHHRSLLGVDVNIFPGQSRTFGSGLEAGRLLLWTHTINRDPGAPPYCLGEAVWWYDPTPHLLGADRNGNVTTITAFSFSYFGASDVELQPRTGDYLVVVDSGVLRVTPSGGQGPFYPGEANVLRITQDDHAWLASGSRLTKLDLARGATVATVPLNLPIGSTVTGIEVWGSRRLTCLQPERSWWAVQVTLQSRNVGDGGQSYALACSRARRPGLRMANGEWLNLDVTDPLFWYSGSGRDPFVFEGFRGTTDPDGKATATVHIPNWLPRNLGVTLFVAGVIYDAHGVRTVTNTHWFVLP